MNLKIITNKITKLLQKIAGLRNKFYKTHYLSIGENCLTDNILDRHKIKSFSTPYSHGRSNLDYAIALEKENYVNFLNSEYLYYDYVGDTKVVRNKYYSKSYSIYNELHKNGFEFTHHDVLNNDLQRKSYERKIARMLSFEKNQDLKFIYHYRNNDDLNIKALIPKAEEFLSYYQKREIKCEFIFFIQEIVQDKSQRSLEKIHDSNNIKGFLLNTLELWAGDDEDVLWAKNDDDLLSKMIQQIK